jgi:hypothetical protein
VETVIKLLNAPSAGGRPGGGHPCHPVPSGAGAFTRDGDPSIRWAAGSPRADRITAPSSAFAQHLGGIIGGQAVQQRRGCGARQRAQQRPCHLRAGFTQHWS